MRKALFYTELENQNVQCTLCPWFCKLNPGQTGICKVRTNESGKLLTHAFNKVAALGIDPIEKKPLYHFYPGKNILSVGEVGCNLQCSFCQNHRISQCFAADFTEFLEMTSIQIVEKALQIPQNIGIAFTYNEPFTFYEFMFETAKMAHNKGLKNVAVSNGYVNPEPLKSILPFIDAFNIDLKAFSEDFYSAHTKGKLNPVLESLKIIAKSPAHLEITNLIIPNLNDDKQQFERMVQWIASELGKYIPLHISRYFPQHKMQVPATSLETLETLYDLAKKHLHHVYLGNVNDELRSATYCAECGKALITRKRFNSFSLGLNPDNCCKYCGTLFF